MAKKIGRPSSYNEKQANEICEWIASGKSLDSYCRQKGSPNKSTVYRWIQDFEEFRNSYVRAREDQAEAFVDQMLEIADDARNDMMMIEGKNGNEKEVVNHEVVMRSKLRIETRKWLAGKMKPKKYGRDMIDVTSGGEKIVSTGFKVLTKKKKNGKKD